MGWFRKKTPQGNVPYVTGLLVTSRRDRHWFAQAAIDSFLAQRWPHIQVVVYNATKVPFKRNSRVRELTLRAMPVEDMRNIALNNADGQYCALLFDDCHYDPGYLKTMMEGIVTEKLHLLKYKEAHSISSGNTHLLDDDRVFCPVWRRTHPARFGPELSQFTERFYNIQRIEASATMVTRFVS